MSKVDKKADSEMLLRTYGGYLLSHLEGHGETGALARFWKEEQETLQARVDERIAAHGQYMMARGPERRICEEIFREIRRFHMEVLYQVGGDRSDSLYRRFFRCGLRPFRREMEGKAVESFYDLVRRIEVDDRKEWRDRGQGLVELYDKLVACRDEIKCRRREYRRAYRREIEQRCRWVEAYKMVRLKLAVQFGNDLELVRAFFWKEKRTSAEKNSSLPVGSSKPLVEVGPAREVVTQREPISNRLVDSWFSEAFG